VALNGFHYLLLGFGIFDVLEISCDFLVIFVLPD